MVELRDHEHRTLLALEKLDGKASLQQVVEESGLPDAAVMRAAMTLKEMNLLEIEEIRKNVASLTSEGSAYARNGLPERRILDALYMLGPEAKTSELLEKAGVPPHSASVAIGWIVKKRWGSLNKEKGTLTLTKNFSAEKPPKGSDEKLLELIAEKGRILLEELDESLRDASSILERRKLIETKEKAFYTLRLTAEGRRLLEKGVKTSEEITQLTPELIITGKWRRTGFRKFNVEAPGPKVYPGKTHPLQQIIQRAREIFLEMGFTEIRGPLVETAFWNFDALFQPQDHPAREMMDTFYLSNPCVGKLPSRAIVEAVAQVHENGWVTGSKGWNYIWSREEAKKLVLRTHTTAETIKYLSRHKKPPIKVFSVDRVYRNEQVTYKNIPEFHQIEGIVLDKDVTLRDLMGTLKIFYSKFGLEKVEFWPCYFPYTEPSAQAMVYHPKLERWIELCGMGLFRPEVLAPMGIKHPVLAWGGGLERLAMIELELDDIRMLYGNHLDWIRRTPICL